MISLCCYLFAPIVAAVCDYSDRRGPVICPEIYHETIFIIVYELLHDGETPRTPPFRRRPLFYGFKADYIPRPVDPKRAAKFDEVVREENKVERE